jgi:hypothetical protein
LIPPFSGYSGVSQVDLDINEGHRTVDGVRRTIDKSSLEIAPASAYVQWIAEEKKKASVKGAFHEAIL